MTPLEELHAAELTSDQDNYFIGFLAHFLSANGSIDRTSWNAAIQQAKGYPA